jgi:hypothetical protein
VAAKTPQQAIPTKVKIKPIRPKTPSGVRVAQAAKPTPVRVVRPVPVRRVKPTDEDALEFGAGEDLAGYSRSRDQDDF